MSLLILADGTNSLVPFLCANTTTASLLPNKDKFYVYIHIICILLKKKF